jgi:hypothetical protein
MVADMSRALKNRAVQRSEKSSLMTEMGQKRTWRPQFLMSAHPPGADIRQRD